MTGGSKKDTDFVYMGYTAEELAIQLDVEKTIENLPEYQQENAAMSKNVAAKLNCIRDLSYGNDNVQMLDIFPPTVNPAPILVDIHGGGWRAGSKNARSFPAQVVTQAGIMWVPIDYGLAPDYSIDQIVDHVRTALVWIYRHGSEFGGDPNNIFVSGNSAGGHLTGCTLMPGWHSDYGAPDNLIKGACAISGIYDLQALVHAEYGYNNELAMDLNTAFRYSPLFHLPSKGCPLLISYGAPEPNEFRRQSRSFYEAWKKCGFPATEIIVEGAHHFSMSRQLSNSDSFLFKSLIQMING